MSIKTPQNGGNRLGVQRLVSNSQTNISGTSLTTMIFDKTETTTVTGDVMTENLELEVSSFINNADFKLFKAACLRNATITSIEKTYEDGSKDTGTAVATNVVKLIVADLNGTIDGKKTITIFPAIWNPDGFGTSRKANELQEIKVKLKAYGADGTITVDADWLNGLYSDILTAMTDVTIATNSYGTEIEVAVK